MKKNVKLSMSFLNFRMIHFFQLSLVDVIVPSFVYLRSMPDPVRSLHSVCIPMEYVFN